MDNNKTPIYEMSINAKVTWHAHSMSNSGSGGSNRTLPRRQLLADGTETDAISGNIAKHIHAALLADYLNDEGQQLCPACARRDSRRAAAITENRSMHKILECGLCDVHGFLIPAKNATNGTDERVRRSKHSVVEFSFALAIPGWSSESPQLYTRTGSDAGNGQMLMKATARSGQYAICIRYLAAGIGVDTDTWQIMTEDQNVRLIRHQAVLGALSDQMLSPSGAMTAKMMPHLAGLSGVIVVQTRAGRAPMYSPLESDYVTQLEEIAARNDRLQLFQFDTVAQFHEKMTHLIQHSRPYTIGERPTASEEIDSDNG